LAKNSTTPLLGRDPLVEKHWSRPLFTSVFNPTLTLEFGIGFFASTNLVSFRAMLFLCRREIERERERREVDKVVVNFYWLLSAQYCVVKSAIVTPQRGTIKLV